MRRAWVFVLAAAAAAGGAACASGGGGGVIPGETDAATGLDDGGGDASDARADATFDDAAAAAMLVALAPEAIDVPRGGTATMTVTLDGPAPDGGAMVTITSGDPAGTYLTAPAVVVVPPGETAASFQVTGVMPGGPLALRASHGGVERTSEVRVVPALTGVATATTDVTAGATVSYTVTIEAVAAGPIDVALSSANPAIAMVPAKVTIPSGSSGASFNVTGVALGGPITIRAAIGDQAVTAPVRVLGLYLSEIYYDAPGSDDAWEWVELYNAAPVPIDVTGMKLKVANTASGYVDSLTLAGVVASGQCVVVGGPNRDPATNHVPLSFVWFVEGNFNPDLGNAGSVAGDPADGLSLATAGGDVVDNVIYGRNNNDLITNEDGVAPTNPDVGDAPTGQSLERLAAGLAGAWAIQPNPNPGDCAAIAP